jgi:hypothetical protein
MVKVDGVVVPLSPPPPPQAESRRSERVLTVRPKVVRKFMGLLEKGLRPEPELYGPSVNPQKTFRY